MPNILSLSPNKLSIKAFCLLIGTYGDRVGLSNATECTDCPSGKYCESAGLSTWTGDCDAGYFCIGKAEEKAPNDMLTGMICPTGIIFIFFFIFIEEQLTHSNLYEKVECFSWGEFTMF